MRLMAEACAETWSKGNIRTSSSWNWSKDGPWNEAAVMEAPQWLVWGSSWGLFTELRVQPHPERIPFMDGDWRCVCLSEVTAVFLWESSWVQFTFIWKLCRQVEWGPTLLPKSITITTTPPPSIPTGPLLLVWVLVGKNNCVINIEELWSQGSWPHPSVCHFAQPVVCWEPVGQFAVPVAGSIMSRSQQQASGSHTLTSTTAH